MWRGSNILTIYVFSLFFLFKDGRAVFKNLLTSMLFFYALEFYLDKHWLFDFLSFRLSYDLITSKIIFCLATFVYFLSNLERLVELFFIDIDFLVDFFNYFSNIDIQYYYFNNSLITHKYIINTQNHNKLLQNHTIQYYTI